VQVLQYAYRDPSGIPARGRRAGVASSISRRRHPAP